MNTEAKHTPGFLEFRAEDSLLIIRGECMTDTLHIARMCHQALETENNAARIVRGWNNYDSVKAERDRLRAAMQELAAALEEFIRMDDDGGLQYKAGNELVAALHDARAALAKHREKA